MFELTICIALSGSRDCFGPVDPEAPIPLCMKHMRAAFLYYADYLENKPEPTDDDRDDAVKLPYRLFRPADECKSVVYYARIGYHVKIGVTGNVHNRMATLMADELYATEPGGEVLERQRHEQFDHCRAKKGREYFNHHPDLLAHIQDLRDHPPARRERKPTAGLVRGVPCPSCDLKALYRRQAYGDARCFGCETVIDRETLASLGVAV